MEGLKEQEEDACDVIWTLILLNWFISGRENPRANLHDIGPDSEFLYFLLLHEVQDWKIINLSKCLTTTWYSGSWVVLELLSLVVEGGEGEGEEEEEEGNAESLDLLLDFGIGILQMV